MKKLFAVLLLVALCAVGVTACGEQPENGTVYSVYAPDGAPALALASLLDASSPEAERLSAAPKPSYSFEAHIVDAGTIQTYVTGKTPKADFCVLPVNAASKLLGNGEVYQMLGTVTHGNLYFLKDASKEVPDLTAENIKTALLGKTVGVLQYEQVPGLTLRVVLEKFKVPYELVDGKDVKADVANLHAVNAAQIVPATGYDYYLCAEPACTTKIGATNGKLALAGDLQALYGGEDGYPQAVLVGKKSAMGDASALAALLEAFKGSEAYLKTASAETLSSLLAGVRTPGMDAAFQPAQLNAKVIANCSVRFTAAKDCKADVTAFLTALRAVSPDAAALPADAFFYAG